MRLQRGRRRPRRQRPLAGRAAARRCSTGPACSRRPPRSSARSVDGFTVGFPTAGARRRPHRPDRRRHERRAPAPVHGFPARLVVAGLYGYVSATKWLSEIRLTTPRGLRRLLDPHAAGRRRARSRRSRASTCRAPAPRAARPVAIAGVAWAPDAGSAESRYRIDNGPWMEAILGEVVSKNTWVQWLYDWADAPPGSHMVDIRATDGTGEVQTEQPATPAPDGTSGYHYRVSPSAGRPGPFSRSSRPVPRLSSPCSGKVGCSRTLVTHFEGAPT